MESITKRQAYQKVYGMLFANVRVVGFYQRQPWTFVEMVTEFDSEAIGTFGFSKVCWPDEWSADKGREIAIERELKRLARVIVRDKLDTMLNTEDGDFLEPKLRNEADVLAVYFGSL